MINNQFFCFVFLDFKALNDEMPVVRCTIKQPIIIDSKSFRIFLCFLRIVTKSIGKIVPFVI